MMVAQGPRHCSRVLQRQDTSPRCCLSSGRRQRTAHRTVPPTAPPQQNPGLLKWTLSGRPNRQTSSPHRSSVTRSVRTHLMARLRGARRVREAARERGEMTCTSRRSDRLLRMQLQTIKLLPGRRVSSRTSAFGASTTRNCLPHRRRQTCAGSSVPNWKWKWGLPSLARPFLVRLFRSRGAVTRLTSCWAFNDIYTYGSPRSLMPAPHITFTSPSHALSIIIFSHFDRGSSAIIYTHSPY